MKKKVWFYVVFLVSIVLMLLGTLLSLQGSSTKKTKPEQKPSTKENRNLSFEEYNEIYPQIIKKASYAELYLNDKFPISNLEKLTSKEKTLFLLRLKYTSDITEINETDLKKEIPNYFNEFELYKKNILNSDHKILYKYEKNKYLLQQKPIKTYSIYSYELSNEATYEYWILKRKIYFLKQQEDKTNIYKSLIDLKKNMPIISYERLIENLTEEEIKLIEPDLNTYRFKFIRSKGNNYILNSITEEK